MTYYDLLGIPIDASAEAIRSAYCAMARRYHPDAGAGSSAETFQRVAEAYETLSDPARRRNYDLSIRPRPMPIRVHIEPIMQPEKMEPENMMRAEPMIRPEPMIRTEPMAPPHLGQVFDEFDEMFRLMEDLFFGPRFR